MAVPSKPHSVQLEPSPVTWADMASPLALAGVEMLPEPCGLPTGSTSNAAIRTDHTLELRPGKFPSGFVPESPWSEVRFCRGL